ncbi:MAG: phospholipid/cholesterol/gamma-HCH transport system permease protein [Pseudohongiellaceae bacterium]|jgi:phospholipid/cholesterol/gamma-HCH transport system permease protein
METDHCSQQVDLPDDLIIIADSDFFRCWQDGCVLHFSLKRDWVLSSVGVLEQEINKLHIEDRRLCQVSFLCGGLRELDLSGAMLLYRTAEMLKAKGMETDFAGFRAEHFKFIEQVLTAEQNKEEILQPPHFLIRCFSKLNHLMDDLSLSLTQRIQFLLSLGRAFRDCIRSPRRFRLIATARHIEEAGVNALPVVLTMGFLIAVVLAFQGQNQLAKFGAQIYTIDLVATSVLREMGVLLTAIMIAGRSGSAFAAEIGVMKLNEEIDAMNTMGIKPFEVLVIPRLIALLISLPLLAFLADIIGLLGTLAVATSLLDIPFSMVIERFLAIDISTHFLIGLIKAPFFALVIALTACYKGFYVSKSADAVGRNTTSAVVESIFLIIAVDAIFSVIFATLNW